MTAAGLRSLVVRAAAGGARGTTSPLQREPRVVLQTLVERHPATTEEVLAVDRALVAHDLTVSVVGEPGYPPRLAASWPEQGAPLWLYRQGPPDWGRRVLGIVGTRRASLEGLTIAGRLASLAARHDVTVVSGLARGIDQAAHRGALEAGGTTAAVQGTGAGVDYPYGDTRLRERIAASGGLYSEYLPGTPPRPHHFLERNRIIAGLVDALVVVEGRARSGALHTARLAAEQGREVWAVPGSPLAPAAQGPLALIRDGARVLTRLEDVLEDLFAQPALLPPGQPDAPPASPLADLLGATPASVADLADALDRPVADVMVALAGLERAGVAHLGPRGAVRAAP